MRAVDLQISHWRILPKSYSTRVAMRAIKLKDRMITVELHHATVSIRAEVYYPVMIATNRVDRAIVLILQQIRFWANESS